MHHYHMVSYSHCSIRSWDWKSN